MNKEWKNLALIEAWLKGNLNEKDKQSFEDRLQNDSAFANEVNEIKSVIAGIREKKEIEIRDLVKSAESELRSEGYFEETIKIPSVADKKPIINSRWMMIAASLLLLISAAYFWNAKADDNNLFEKNYVVENKILPEVMGRLEAKGLAGNEAAKKEQLLNAIKRYNNKDYKKSKVALQKFILNFPNEETALLYLGLCEIELGNIHSAIKFLVPLANDSGFKYQKTAQWYSVLCYLKEGKTKDFDAAEQLLNQLLKTESEYYKKGVELKNKLKSLE